MTCPFMDPNGGLPPQHHAGGGDDSGSESLTAEQRDAKKFSILGFETEMNNQGSFTNARRAPRLCNYTDYIKTEELLQLQDGESIMKPEGRGMMHHEELLFIVTHQSIELWFKVLLNDLHKGRDIMKRAAETHAEHKEQAQHGGWRQLELVGQYLRRATMIFHHAADSFAVLQTMHPADFLEFRDFLVPASGFQSFQFRQIEILLGQNESKRAECNDAHVFSALQSQQREACEKEIGRATSLREAVELLLLRVNVPENFMDTFMRCTEDLHVQRQQGLANHSTEKARELAQAMVDDVRDVIRAPDSNLPDDHPGQARASKVIEAALYVSSYRACHPHFAVLSEILDELVALEEGLLLFRARHLHNVERVIGRRVGTGGSSGVEYLERTRQYRIFTPLWALRRVFLRSSILPSFSELHAGRAPADVHLFKETPIDAETVAEKKPAAEGCPHAAKAAAAAAAAAAEKQ